MDEAQIADVDGASHKKRRRSKQFTEAQQTQTERTRHRECKSGQSKDMERTTSSDGDNTRHFTKIVSFSINNITGHGYFIQLITKMLKLMNNLMKKFLRPKKPRRRRQQY